MYKSLQRLIQSLPYQILRNFPDPIRGPMAGDNLCLPVKEDKRMAQILLQKVQWSKKTSTETPSCGHIVSSSEIKTLIKTLNRSVQVIYSKDGLSL